MKVTYDPILGKLHIAADADHDVDTTTLSGKIIISQDGNSYAVTAERIVKPGAPTLPASATFYNSRTVAITADSGAVIYYTTDGSTPTKNSTQYASAITIGSTAAVSTVYTIKAIAVKNGMTSDVATATYTCYRKVATPTFSNATGNKYSASRTITFACATSGATIQYKIGSGEWQTGSSVTVSTTSNIYIRAILTDWVDSSERSTTYELNAGKCYIGQAASVTTEADIKALANAYERDTILGWTAPTIDFGSSTQYVWFAIPNTAARSLTVKSDGFAVPLQAAAGTVIGAYRVWRTENQINSSFTFQFS